jgi:hypothetical protein
MALSWQAPTPPMEGTSPDALARWLNAQEVKCTPWSEWISVPAAGRRDSIAIPRALVTSAAVGVVSIDQPTTRSEQASSTPRSRPCLHGWGAR